MSAHIQQAGILSGRSMTLVAVIALHAVVITALIAIRIVPDMIDPGPQSLLWVPDITPPDRAPVPRPLDTNVRKPLQMEQIVIPQPAPIQLESAESITLPADAPASAMPGDAAESGVTAGPAARVVTELQYRAVRPTDDYYPSASVMLEERGVAIVRVCVAPSGRIDGQPTIESSSGHRRLDQAAIRWAQESLRFTPATVDGAAVAACKGFRVNFTLR